MHPNCSIPKTESAKEIILVSIGFLKKYKNDFGINKITLTDNSMKYIDNCKDRITLSQYYFLTHGHTWYGSFGFRPFDNIANKPDEKKNRAI